MEEHESNEIMQPQGGMKITIPETNIAFDNVQGNLIFRPLIFTGEVLVSREGNNLWNHSYPDFIPYTH